MKNIFLILFLLSSITSTVVAQNIDRPDVIFFRLPDMQSKISRAERQGRDKEVKNLERIVLGYRNAIISDFRKNFTFCDVYFFNESDLKQFTSGDWSQISFWGKQGQKVEFDKPENYLVANFGIKPPVYTRSADGKSWVNDNVQSRAEDGIVLRDKNIKPLRNKLVFTNAALNKKGVGFLKPKSTYYVFMGAFQLELKLNKMFQTEELLEDTVE